ncbi:MAG: helix-turn-helix transcriptional regulator [Cellvibrionaceae bacterium]
MSMPASDLAESQEALLLKLKQKGPQTVKNLSELMDMTTMGIRQHLAVLAEKNLVAEAPEQKQQRGRPVKPWRLTKLGHERFPDGHSQISVELIAAVKDTFGEEGLEKLIDKHSKKTWLQYKEALDNHTNLSGKIKKLSELRSREGYMSEVEKSGKEVWFLIENHCPICVAATACQGFCRSELEMFQKLLKGLATVERTDHILLGARRCAYKISRTS